MKIRDEISAVPRVTQWRVWDPASGRSHVFEREDAALGFAADLAVCHAVGPGRTETPVGVDYPSGARIELSARITRQVQR